MLCQKCHKNLASVRYAEVVDGQVNDLHLCHDCLNQQQDEVKTGFDLSDPPPFIRPGRAAKASAPAAMEICPSCETELQTVLKSGRVGCARCYDKVSAELESLLEGIHDGLAHHGKTPHIGDERAIARAVGVHRVIIPPHPGLSSAFGALLADMRVDKTWTYIVRSDNLNAPIIDKRIQELEKEAVAELSEEGFAGTPTVRRSSNMRYLVPCHESTGAIT